VCATPLVQASFKFLGDTGTDQEDAWWSQDATTGRLLTELAAALFPNPPPASLPLCDSDDPGIFFAFLRLTVDYWSDQSLWLVWIWGQRAWAQHELGRRPYDHIQLFCQHHPPILTAHPPSLSCWVQSLWDLSSPLCSTFLLTSLGSRQVLGLRVRMMRKTIPVLVWMTQTSYL